MIDLASKWTVGVDDSGSVCKVHNTETPPPHNSTFSVALLLIAWNRARAMYCISCLRVTTGNVWAFHFISSGQTVI